MLALIIPGILWAFEHLIGPLTDAVKPTIISKLSSLGVSNDMVSSIMGVFQEHMSMASQEQQEKFQLALQQILSDTQLVSQSMNGQIYLNSLEAVSEHFFDRGWRPFTCWGIGVNLIAHYTIVNIVNTMNSFFICHLPMPIPLDNMFLAITSGLFGFYMMCRTAEKSKGVN